MLERFKMGLEKLKMGNIPAEQKQGFNFNFDFTRQKGWDKSISKDGFNALVNEAANKCGSSNSCFVEYVENSESPAKKMVLHFLGDMFIIEKHKNDDSSSEAKRNREV